MSFGKDMQKGAKASKRNTYIILFAIILVGGFWGYGHFSAHQFNTIGTPINNGVSNGNTVSTSTTGCPPSNTGITTVNLALRNSLNNSAQYLAETFAIFENGNYISSVTTNNGSTRNYSTVSLNSGQTYKLYGISNTGANAKLISASGTGNVALSPDNSFITVKAECSNTYVNLVGTAHADSLDVRMYDQADNGYFYGFNESSNTNWVTMNSTNNTATFYTIISNSTAQTVNANGEVNMIVNLRATNDYQNMNDFGYLVLVNAGTSALTQWNDFSITVNGKIYNSDTSALTTFEQKAFSADQWAFVVNQPLKRTTTAIHIDMTATSQQPKSNIIVTIVPRGQFINQAENGVLQGAAKDDSTFSIPVDSFTIVKAIN